MLAGSVAVDSRECWQHNDGWYRKDVERDMVTKEQELRYQCQQH